MPHLIFIVTSVGVETTTLLSPEIVEYEEDNCALAANGMIFEINIPQPSICFLILLKRLEIASGFHMFMTDSMCHMGRQSLNPKSLMNGLKRDL